MYYTRILFDLSQLLGAECGLKYSSISSYQTPYIGTTDIIGPFNSFGVAIGYRQGF